MNSRSMIDDLIAGMTNNRPVIAHQIIDSSVSI
jgi:hypothetical protein